MIILGNIEQNTTKRMTINGANPNEQVNDTRFLIILTGSIVMTCSSAFDCSGNWRERIMAEQFGHSNMLPVPGSAIT